MDPLRSSEDVNVRVGRHTTYQDLEEVKFRATTEVKSSNSFCNDAREELEQKGVIKLITTDGYNIACIFGKLFPSDPGERQHCDQQAKSFIT